MGVGGEMGERNGEKGEIFLDKCYTTEWEVREGEEGRKGKGKWLTIRPRTKYSTISPVETIRGSGSGENFDLILKLKK